MLAFARRALLGVMVFGTVPVATSQATIIEYDTSNIAGTTWRYDYTVANNTLGASLNEFTIFFGRDLYQNVSLGGAPAGWDPLAIEPDPNLPDSGFYDALALGSGLAPGSGLSGFFVMFDWLGAGTPASQLFNVVDAETIETLEVGFTVPRVTTPPTTPVPEPSLLSLLAVAMLVGGLSVWRNRTG